MRMELKNSTKIAIVDENGKLSYGDLISRASHIARSLKIEEGTRVALCAENSANTLATIVGIWLAKGVVFLMDPRLKSKNINEILSQSSPQIVVMSPATRNTFGGTLEKLNIENIVVTNDWDFENINDSIKKLDIVLESKDDLSTVVYTSGTTGKMLGVKLSNKNIFFSIKGLMDGNLINENDALMSILPLHHAYGLVTAFSALFSHGTLILPKVDSSSKIMEMIRENRPTTISSVPLFYKKLHKIISKRLGFLGRTIFKLTKLFGKNYISNAVFSKVHESLGGRIRYLSSGGANLPTNIAKDFETMGLKIISGYGLSEAGPIISCSLDGPIGSVGRPITEVKIVNREILAKGPGIMIGYFNDEDETQNRIKDEFLYTGDLGYIRDGFLHIDGRKKDLITLENGKNIWPYEIESEMVKCREINECVAVEKDGEIYIFVIPTSQTKESEIDNFVLRYNRRVEPYKKVKKYIFVDEIERTNLGKVKRYTLLKKLLN